MANVKHSVFHSPTPALALGNRFPRQNCTVSKGFMKDFAEVSSAMCSSASVTMAFTAASSVPADGFGIPRKV